MKQISIRVHAWYRRMAKPKRNNISHTVVLCVMTLACYLIQTWHFHLMTKVKLKSNDVLQNGGTHILHYGIVTTQKTLI